MRVKLHEIQDYAKTLASLSDVAESSVSSSIAMWMTQHPDATVAECREFAKSVVTAAVERYGDAAAVNATRLYDDVMAAEGVAVEPAALYEGPNAGKIDGTVRRQAAKLVGDSPDVDGFIRQVGTLAQDMVHAAANETVAKNVERDAKTKKGKSVRFARVPQRAVPCEWCAMLASRGFVYTSSDAAEAGSHHNCTCIVVPGIKGKTRVDGYDPDLYYDLWKHPENYRPVNTQTGQPGVLSWTSSHNVTVSQRDEGLPSGRSGVALKTATCDVYTTRDGIEVIFPQGMNPSDQAMTPQHAIELLDMVPSEIRTHMQRKVYFVDYANPSDAHWRRVYKNFTRSYATGGNEITFYASSSHDDRYVIRTYCHEAGHYIDKQNGNVSGSAQWANAKADDYIASGKTSPTTYGDNADVEDFAESVACWATDRQVFELEFVNRAKVIAGLVT